jgi:hypothetical protein
MQKRGNPFNGGDTILCPSPAIVDGILKLLILFYAVLSQSAVSYNPAF